MRAFGVEITPLFLAILSSSSSVCGGEPTQGEEGKTETERERDREEVWWDLIGRTDGREVFSISKSATPTIWNGQTKRADCYRWFDSILRNGFQRQFGVTLTLGHLGCLGM